MTTSPRQPLDEHHLEEGSKGSPKHFHWWYTMSEQSELHVKEMDLTWGEAQHAALKDWSHWKQIVDAFCPTRDVEDY